MELNDTKCKHFESSFKEGRCPFTEVCNDNCVFVWKKLYDENLLGDYLQMAEDVEKLTDELECTEEDCQKWQKDYDELQADYDNLQEDYNNLEEDYNKLESEYASLLESENE